MSFALTDCPCLRMSLLPSVRWVFVHRDTARRLPIVRPLPRWYEKQPQLGLLWVHANRLIYYRSNQWYLGLSDIHICSSNGDLRVVASCGHLFDILKLVDFVALNYAQGTSSQAASFYAYCQNHRLSDCLKETAGSEPRESNTRNSTWIKRRSMECVNTFVNPNL